MTGTSGLGRQQAPNNRKQRGNEAPHL